jgi:N-acetylmuramoyl-L-alanine amidase
VLGHSDVAPARKQDPGELFDWAWLAARGIGLWPAPAPGPKSTDLAADLARIGYDSAEPASLAAFQRHFRPARVDGHPDSETRIRIAQIVRCLPLTAPLSPP